VLEAEDLRHHFALGRARQDAETGILGHHPAELAIVLAQDRPPLRRRPLREGVGQVLLGHPPTQAEPEGGVAKPGPECQRAGPRWNLARPRRPPPPAPPPRRPRTRTAARRT